VYLPVLGPSEKCTLDSEPETKQASPETRTSTKDDQDFSSSSTTESHLIIQAESRHLVRNLDLPKTKTQLLGSLLQQWNLLEQSVKESFFWKEAVDYCKELQLQHAPEQWRLFIDSSKVGLKTVLLNNRNKHTSVLLRMQFGRKKRKPTFKVC